MPACRLSCDSRRPSLLFAGLSGVLACLLTLPAICGASSLAGTSAQFTGTFVTLGGGFTTPSGVAVDPSGNVYVVNSASSSGTVTEIPVGCFSSGCVVSLGVTLANPTGLAVDSAGNVYVVTSGGTSVTEIPSGCSSSSCTIALGGGFANPTGVAVDQNGNIYVADNQNFAVKEMAPGCSSSSCVGILGGLTYKPGALAVDSGGNVYYTTMTTSPAVWEVPLNCRNSNCEKQIGSGFTSPQGVAVDEWGNVFVADSASAALLEVPESCVKGANYSSCMTTLGSFSSPAGVAVDPHGNPYVADSPNNAVKEIMLNGVNFFTTAVNTTTAAQTLTFTFSVGGTIAAPKIFTEGVTGQDFKDAGTGICTTNGTAHTYSIGSSCTVDVTFDPSHPGIRHGAVELATNAGAVVGIGYLYGTGEGPQATFYNQYSQYTIGSGFSYPAGVAVDGSGNFYVADAFATSAPIKEFTASSGYTSATVLGSGFDHPAGVAVDGAGNVYVADSDNNDIWELTPGCNSTNCMTLLGGGFNTPRALTVDGGGNVFVADYGNNQVKEIPAGCTNAQYLANNCAVPTLGGGFLFPQGVAVDGSGNVYVGDSGNSLVKEIPPGCIAASCVQTVASNYSFSGPTAVAVDGGGDVYVADTGNSAVEEIPPGCNSSSCVQVMGFGFSGPSGVAVDASGDIFVGDSSNAQADELNLSTIPTLAFQTTAAGQTSSDSPQEVILSNSGNQALAISDISYPADFPEDSGATCNSPSTLPTGAFCYLSADFSPLPTSGGTLNESLNLMDNNLIASSSATQQIPLTGSVLDTPYIISPAPATPPTVLSGSNVTFTWNAGSGVSAYMLDVGTTGPGSSDVYAGSSTTATSAAVAVPTRGVSLYVRLSYEVNGNWQYSDYVYTEAGSATAPYMTSPAPGPPQTVLSGANVTFTWNPGSGNVLFKLEVGTTGPGAYDVYSSPKGTTATSIPVTVPTTGANLYVRIYYAVNGLWQKVDYVYTQAGTLTAPNMTSPAPGPPQTVLTGSNVTFTWNAGSGAAAFMLYIGTRGVGSHDVYVGTPTTATSLPVTVPSTGANLYVRLLYEVNNAWQWLDYVYTQSGTLAAPYMTSPSPGPPQTVLTGSNVTFTWNAGSGPAAFVLNVGTQGPGSADVYAGTPTTATSIPLTAPATGANLYVQLNYQLNGKWQSLNYVYTQAGTLAAPYMTSPAPGPPQTVLSGANVTFTWNPGSGNVLFKLEVGTTGPGAYDVYSSPKGTTATSIPVTVPTTGANLYVRIYYAVNGLWQKVDYVYTQAGTLTAPNMTSPAPGPPQTVLTGSNVTFTWNAGSGAAAFMLYIGTRGVGSHDVYVGTPTTATSLPVTVPSTGANLYVRLLYEVNNAWQWLDYVYTQSGTLAAPYMTSPSPGPPQTVLTGSNVTFTWNAGSGPAAFVLNVGTQGPGSADVYAGTPTTATSIPLTAPATGANLYVQLNYQLNGKWQSLNYVYTQAGTLAAPYMTSPAPGPPQTVLSGANVTFTWNPGSGNVLFKLEVGTTGPGAYDVYSSPKGTTATSIPVTVPTTGANLYVRIYYAVNGLWQKVDYVYTQAP